MAALYDDMKVTLTGEGDAGDGGMVAVMLDEMEMVISLTPLLMQVIWFREIR